MSKDDSGPAFPGNYTYQVGDGHEFHGTACGMTKRELIAMHVISGLVTGRREVVSVLAREAVLMADALLAELAKE